MSKHINLAEFAHHDLGWHKLTYELESEQCFKEINTALDLMEKYPDFKWTHESSVFSHNYLRHYPERHQELNARVKEGRFAFGANYAIPYTSYVSEETLIRNLMLGKKWTEETFPDAKCNVYFNTDVPNMNAQLPQILHKSDIEYMFITRIWNVDDFMPNEYMITEAPDGTRIKTHYNRHYSQHYWAFPNGFPGQGLKKYAEEKAVNPDLPPDMFLEQAAAAYKVQRDKECDILFLCSNDCLTPDDFAKEMKVWNESEQGKKLPVVYTTYPEALEKIFAECKNLRLVKGEIPNRWVYESTACDYRTFLAQREAGRLATIAEMLSVAQCLYNDSFGAYQSALLDKIWRGACFCDHTYAPVAVMENIQKTYSDAFTSAADLVEENVSSIAATIAPARSGVPVVVVNPLCSTRQEVAEIDLSDVDQAEYSVYTSDGVKLDSQQTGNQLSVLVPDVPASGFTTLYLAPEQQGGEDNSALGTTPCSYENDYYKITFADGGVASVYDKEFCRELFDNAKFLPFELICFDYDGYGCGEMIYIQQPDPENYRRMTRNNGFVFSKVASGDVKTVFRASNTTECGTTIYTLTLYNKLKRIDFDVTLENIAYDKYKQPRIMLPINGDMRVNYSTPFGSIEVGRDEMFPDAAKFNNNLGDYWDTANRNNSAMRPREVQDSICIYDDSFTTRISTYNVLWDYADPTVEPVKTPVLQPVLFSNSRNCHWEEECWVQTGTQTYHFSVFSGSKSDTLAKKAVEHNNPLICRAALNPNGKMGRDKDSFILCEDNGISVTAVKKAEDSDDVILRFYSDATPERTVSFKLAFSPTGAEEVTFIERDAANSDFAEPVSVEGNVLTTSIRPFQIKTIRIKVKG